MSATDTSTRPMPAIGERRMSFIMTPNALNGRPIQGGNAWANADTIEDARAYAERVFAGGVMGYQVGSVSIYGRLMRFTGSCWDEAYRTDPSASAQTVSELVVRTTPVDEYRGTDLRVSCYPTTVLDYFEIVHERRSDGSCRCGAHAPTYGVTR